MGDSNVDNVKSEVAKFQKLDGSVEGRVLKRSRNDFDGGGKEREQSNIRLSETVLKSKPSPVADKRKKGESMGLIFICNAQTKRDCFRYNVLGHPYSRRELVAKVYKGMRLFLFDTDLRLMYGIFKAAEPGGYNVEPKAFNSCYPAQVRFCVFDDCLPLPEEKFRDVIKENYYSRTKFECLLSAEQMKKLCKLFQNRFISNNDWTNNKQAIPMSPHSLRGFGVKRFPVERFPPLVDPHRPPFRSSFLESEIYTSPTRTYMLGNAMSSLQPPLSTSPYGFRGSEGFDHRRELLDRSVKDLSLEFERIGRSPMMPRFEFDERHHLSSLTRSRVISSGLPDYVGRNVHNESDGYYLRGDPYSRLEREEPRVELHDHRVAVLRRDGQIEVQDRQLTRLQTRPQGLERTYWPQGLERTYSGLSAREDILDDSSPLNLYHEVPPWHRAREPDSPRFYS